MHSLLFAAATLGLAIIPVAALANPCPTQLGKVRFSGTFKLKNNSQPLKFVIGDTAFGTSTAQIWAGNQCQAICSNVRYESDLEAGAIPISLDLQCRGVQVGALSTHVAVLWGVGKQASTQLRFGSWVEGYEQASVQVDVDHFAMAEKAPSKTRLASRTPGFASR